MDIFEELGETNSKGLGAALDRLNNRASDDPNVQNICTDLICGGDLPVRAALALAIVFLYLQSRGRITGEIAYTDADYNPKKILRGGKVVPYVAPHANDW